VQAGAQAPRLTLRSGLSRSGLWGSCERRRPVPERHDEPRPIGGISPDAGERLDVLGSVLRLADHEHQSEPLGVNADLQHRRGQHIEGRLRAGRRLLARVLRAEALTERFGGVVGRVEVEAKPVQRPPDLRRGERGVSSPTLSRPNDIPRGTNFVLADHGYREVRAVDEIYVRMPQPDEVQRLILSAGTPVAAHYVTGYTAKDEPIRCDVFILPGDRHVILFEHVHPTDGDQRRNGDDDSPLPGWRATSSSPWETG
jgi:hypothetical protein